MDKPRLSVIRNEVDADYEYHCDALAAVFPEAEEVDFPAGERPDLVEADLADDPLFAGVSPVVQVIHGDVVTENGDDMTVIAATEHAPVFGTRHRSAPLWTVQFHPELTAGHRDVLEADFDWNEGEFSFADVSTEALFGNFRELVAMRTSG